MEKSAAASVQSNSYTPIKKKSVLLIDDTADLLELQKTILELDDFEVSTAQSGAEALSVLNHIDHPDLILLDVRMGDMSGPEFLTLLEKNLPEVTSTVPVVFLTAMDQIPEANVVGFIRKPFDVDNFLEAVHGYIDIGIFSGLKH
jgi:CheY-like chemotaxis protein